ncbi:unnamed protein product [Callosobruchus maculatus]|uniref:Uncharacterized protein n=1 Tax=Callosobruchus maculatus TaxID=64391 RepID=A0A653CP73_CALMS|nr:unnamed protein product [Callosobruchus maculatus]
MSNKSVGWSFMTKQHFYCYKLALPTCGQTWVCLVLCIVSLAAVLK